jgi:acyl-CoA synthetase (AMP-forming)/AMP-acid ligase II
MELLVGDLFRNAARAAPKRVAAVVGDESLTFGRIDTESDRIARVLADLQVAKGDLVLVRTETDVRLIPLFAALAKMGAVFAPLNPALNDLEVASILDRARPALVIARHPSSGSISLEEISIRSASKSGADTSSPLSERDPHVVFFTSGSTGRSKGVVLSHRANVRRSNLEEQPSVRIRCSTWVDGRSPCSNGPRATRSSSSGLMRRRSARRSSRIARRA